MKNAILLLSLLISTKTFAFVATEVTLFTPWATTLSFNQPKVARAILNETNEYYQTGKLTLRLENEVAQIQAVSDLSVDEAIDLINETAFEALK